MSQLKNKTKQSSNQLSNDALPDVTLNQDMEAQVAQHVISLLDSSAADINNVTAERLLAARNNAVAKLAAQQTQTSQQHGNALVMLGGSFNRLFEQHRLGMSALIVAGMLLAFFTAQEYTTHESLERGDAFLLASDLPPEAYVDQGFDTWLDTTTD